jgi:drug/metabolite transporter (DMT)-like permease
MPADASHRHVLLLVFAMASWGCGTVLSKQVLDRGVAPLTLLAIELAASSLLLSLTALALKVRLTRSSTLTKLTLLGILNLNRPGESGDSSPWEGWSHVRENVNEVPGRAA